MQDYVLKKKDESASPLKVLSLSAQKNLSNNGTILLFLLFLTMHLELGGSVRTLPGPPDPSTCLVKWVWLW